MFRVVFCRTYQYFVEFSDTSIYSQTLLLYTHMVGIVNIWCQGKIDLEVY